jgi:hypothetical protein
LILILREGFVMLELDGNRRSRSELLTAEYPASADDVNFARTRDLDGKDEGETDLGTLLHAITGPEQNPAEREIASDGCRVRGTRCARQRDDLLDGYTRIVAAFRACAHLLRSMIGVNCSYWLVNSNPEAGNC